MRAKMIRVVMVVIAISFVLLILWPFAAQPMAERSCQEKIPGSAIIRANCVNGRSFIIHYLDGWTGGWTTWDVGGEYGPYDVTLQANIRLKHGGMALDEYDGWIVYVHKVERTVFAADGKTVTSISYDGSAQKVLHTERELREFFTPERKAEKRP